MVRHHKGIIQNGGNKGQLKKGYRYTGKKTKTGLAIITRIKKIKGGKTQKDDIGKCHSNNHSINIIDTINNNGTLICKGFRTNSEGQLKHMISIDIQKPNHSHILAGLYPPFVVKGDYNLSNYQEMVLNYKNRDKKKTKKKIYSELASYEYKYYKPFPCISKFSKLMKKNINEDCISNLIDTVKKYNLLDKNSLNNTIYLKNIGRESKSRPNAIFGISIDYYSESKGYAPELLYRIIQYFKKNSNYNQMILYAMTFTIDGKNDTRFDHPLVQYYKSFNMDLMLLPYTGGDKLNFTHIKRTSPILIGKFDDILNSERMKNLDKNLKIEFCTDTKNTKCNELIFNDIITV